MDKMGIKIRQSIVHCVTLGLCKRTVICSNTCPIPSRNIPSNSRRVRWVAEPSPPPNLRTESQWQKAGGERRGGESGVAATTKEGEEE